jgi:hypothetical protein
MEKDYERTMNYLKKLKAKDNFDKNRVEILKENKMRNLEMVQGNTVNLKKQLASKIKAHHTREKDLRLRMKTQTERNKANISAIVEKNRLVHEDSQEVREMYKRQTVKRNQILMNRYEEKQRSYKEF